ncbi:MAG: amidohydrolase [Clostridia bacterium]|nr:amidohydrolase [Clostridia bacterium]
MDKIFYNGLIKTMDKAYPYVEAVAVQDGIILHLGKYEDIVRYRTDDTEMVDLEGNFMYPGFIDTHLHTVEINRNRKLLDLRHARSFEEALRLVKERSEQMDAEGNDGWLVSIGFNENDWSDKKEIPSRLDLDSVCSNKPCCLQRVCGHTVTYNTKALELCGCMDEKPGETKRNMDFFPDGTPQGQMYENDGWTFLHYMPVPSVEEFKECFRLETKEYAKLGLVAVHSGDINQISPVKDNANIMQAYQEAAEEGLITTRLYVLCRVEQPDLLREFVKKYPMGTTFGPDKKVKLVCVKELMDGSLGAHSGFMRGGYLNDPDAANVSTHTDEEINELVDIANEAGYPVCAHCIGDAAVDQLLNAFEYAQHKHPRADLRNGVIHCQIMGFDELERMQRDGILAYVQPVFIRADAAIVDDCVGVEIGKQSYNWRKMWDLGLHVSSGSDCPIESNDPLNNIYYAVTRDGGNGKPWNPECAMTMEEAIASFTIEAAYAAYEEQRRGSISAGKYADFTVLDRNLMEIDPWTIRDTKVVMTVIDGKIAYRAGREE